jgi:hypothetical protein
VTYQQQSAALAARVCGVGEVRGVEDGVALAQELGLKGFSSMGRGGACVNVAQEVLSAAWVKSKDLTRRWGLMSPYNPTSPIQCWWFFALICQQVFP